MKIFSITEGRRKLGELVNTVKFQRCTIALGNHGKAEALLIANISPEDAPLSMAAANAASGSFAFLEAEPDIYTIKDLKKRYA